MIKNCSSICCVGSKGSLFVEKKKFRTRQKNILLFLEKLLQLLAIGVI